MPKKRWISQLPPTQLDICQEVSLYPIQPPNKKIQPFMPNIFVNPLENDCNRFDSISSLEHARLNSIPMIEPKHKPVLSNFALKHLLLTHKPKILPELKRLTLKMPPLEDKVQASTGKLLKLHVHGKSKERLNPYDNLRLAP